MKHRLSSGAVCLAWLGVCVALPACDVKVGEQGMSFDVTQGRANDEWTRTYTLSKAGRLEIASGGGPVYVTASDDPTVKIRIVREAHGNTDEAARQALKDESIGEEAAPDRVRVETVRKPGDNRGAFGRRRISTEWHVEIPPGLNVAIKGENADLTLTDVSGNFTLENTNGGFRASGLSGSATANTINGVVDLDLVEITGDIRATTVNGPIRIGLAPTTNAALDARVVNGAVSIDENLPFTASVRERLHIAGQFGKGGPAITLQTTNGPVRIGGPRGRGRRGGEPVVIERERRER